MTAEAIQSENFPLCSVVITTWQRSRFLEETIRSVQRQSYPRLEVIVVCDGEDPEVRSIANRSEAQGIRWLFHAVNRGLPAARNTGLREATGEIVLFLDDDVVADCQLVSVHVQHHLRVGSLRRVAVIGMVQEERETPIDSFVNARLHESYAATLRNRSAVLSAQGIEEIGERFDQTVWFGLNSSIRRNLILETDGFDEHLRTSDEESELGLRLHLSGIEFLFEPRILLTHRNAKELSVYFRHCWSATGGVDVYRIFELGQRNAQTSGLISMFTGNPLKCATSRLLWNFSGNSKSFLDLLEKATNQTRSHVLFSIWARSARPTEFVEGVKSSGCTLGKLQQVIQPAKCALMLHSIHEAQSAAEASYYISPRRFRRLMNWFSASGRRTASLSQYLKGDTDSHHVLLTFDDGYDDLYEELMPLAVEKGYTAVIYLVADRIGGSNVWDQQNGLRARKLLTVEQIREMQKFGFEFGSHTLTHAFLPYLPDAQLEREVVDSKHRLQDLLGTEVSSFAYPSGGIDRRVRSAVARAGYQLAFTTMPGMNFWNDPLCQRRAEVNEYTSVLDFFCLLNKGQSVVPWVSETFKSLESDLPSKVLRSAIGVTHRATRAVFRTVRRID